MKSQIGILRMFLTLAKLSSQGILYIVIGILLLFYCLHPLRFASHYSYIQPEDIHLELVQAYPKRVNSCSINISGRKFSQLLYPNENPREEPSSLAKRLSILPGGQWKPKTCQPLFRIAVILPYRNRLKQLKIFMNYIHPFLQRQKLEYRIFVIEQTLRKEFNRAKLFNVGFSEALKLDSFQCFIFHDIDLIPQNPDNIYACTKMPRHMSSSVNTFRYNLPYSGLFGGAIALTADHFQKVNGFSNIFYGWGGEDDDLYSRVLSKSLKVIRFSPDVAQYYMLTHKKEAPNRARYANLKNSSKRVDSDGISDLQYRVLDHQLEPLYSWILVDI